MASTSTRTMCKHLIWVYLLLLLFDGALRKWFLTPLADVLLISRLPITLLIYALALQGKYFPRSGFVAGAVVLAVISFPLAMLSHGNAIVSIYGVITNYVSIPLIFIIPKVFDYYETEKLGRFLLFCVIPMTVLIALQFYSPQSAWVNRSVGGEEGAGFYGALDRYRPPGTFSFITGVAQFYTLAFAFFLAQFVNQRTLPLWFLLPTGAAFVMAVYGSISRLLALSIILVFLFCAAGMVINGRKLDRSFRIGVFVIIFFAIASQFGYFKDGTEVFLARWEAAKAEDEGVKEAVMDRVIGSLTSPFINIDFEEPIGAGLGAGTNVGAKLLTGQRGFLEGEGEWFRIMNELGPLFGFMYILYRVALTFYLGSFAFRMLKTGNLLPWLIFGSAVFLVLNGQWGQQTTLGFTILSAGLILSAGRIIKATDDSKTRGKQTSTQAPGNIRQQKSVKPIMS